MKCKYIFNTFKNAYCCLQTAGGNSKQPVDVTEADSACSQRVGFSRQKWTFATSSSDSTNQGIPFLPSDLKPHCEPQSW